MTALLVVVLAVLAVFAVLGAVADYRSRRP